MDGRFDCPSFSDLSDPRSDQGKRHLLGDLLAITILAIICEADEALQNPVQ